MQHRGGRGEWNWDRDSRAMLGTVLLLLALAKPVCPSPDSAASRRAEALKRLLEVFGMEDPPPAPAHVKQPPQYMVDLFNTVANADGVTKNPDILEGNTVRSFLDKSKDGGSPRCWGRGCGRGPGTAGGGATSGLAPLPNCPSLQLTGRRCGSSSSSPAWPRMRRS